ncbi:MAG: hypothetical protein V1752_00010 [Candidatus Firestonebacteria bacterium]
MMKLFSGAIVLFLIFTVCFLLAAQDGILSAKIKVYEDSVIKKADRGMLGYNNEWGGTSIIVMDNNDIRTLGLAEDYLNIFKGYPMPLNRMSGTVSQVLKWKWAMGPLEERKEQKLTDWDRMSKKRLGPVEWIKSVLLIDPAAEFTWTLNMTEPVMDHADLAEFFTGDGNSNPNGGVNWAKKRIELEIENPVNVAIWELGNELDWGAHRQYFPTVDVYIDSCKKAIAEVRKVHPEAKFAAHAATAVFATEYHKRYGGWETWHRKVLEQLGDQIDYIVYHPYYNDKVSVQRQESYMDIIKADILKITGSNRIKFYLSEHAMHPDHIRPDTKPNWYRTHALSGVLLTAEWMNRMLTREDVAALAYHAFSSGPWGLVYRDERTRKLYTTGIFDLFKVLNEAYGESVVKTNILGDFTDTKKSDCAFTAVAMTTKQGLNLILVNRDPLMKRGVSFEFRGKYVLLKETTLTAKDMDACNTVDRKEITVTSKDINNKENFNSYVVPAKSILVLYLKKQE